MAAVDKDGSGSIEMEEFVFMIGKRMQKIEEHDLLEAFRVWLFFLVRFFFKND